MSLLYISYLYSQGFFLDTYDFCLYNHGMNTKRRAGRPPKSSDKLKSAAMLIRAEPAEKQTFQSAAELAGVPLSIWVRERLRAAAIRELEAAGLRIEFLNTTRD